MMQFIDTHVHFYDEAFTGDEDLVIQRALDAGVVKMIQPDVDSKERTKLFSLSERFPGTLFSMLGLYPGSVDENWEREIEEMLKFADKPIVAIGEIGLDYHYTTETSEYQKLALKYQFEFAARLNLPVNIHLRDATEDFFKVLEESRHLNLRGNLHAFSGSYETFQRIQKYGDWYVGIGGVVTFKNSRLAEAVKKIPLEKILLETDSPYLTPVPYRGKRNESSYIPIIAGKIAEVKNISLEEVAHTTTSNAKNLFGI